MSMYRPSMHTRPLKPLTGTMPSTPQVLTHHSKGFHPHRLFRIGTYLIVATLIAVNVWLWGYYIIAPSINAWRENSTYGNPPTFQIDAVVGHSDNTAHPSHFIATVYNGYIEIIEFPGGNVSHALVYQITIYSQSSAVIPVTLSFEGTGSASKMFVHYGTSTLTYVNVNGKFVPKPNS